MTRQKYIDEINKKIPKEVKSELFSVLEEIFQDLTLQDYETIVKEIGKPDEFIKEYLKNRTSTIPDRERPAFDLFLFLRKIRNKVTKARILHLYYLLVTLLLVYFLFISILPTSIDFSYARLYTWEEFANDTIQDATIDDNGNIFILMNSQNPVLMASPSEAIKKIQNPFPTSNWGFYQLIPQNSGFGGYVVIENDNGTWSIFSYSYDLITESWTSDIKRNFQSSIKSPGLFKIIYTEDENDHRFLVFFESINLVSEWEMLDIRSDFVASQFINSTLVQELLGYQANLTRLDSAIYHEGKIHLFFRDLQKEIFTGYNLTSNQIVYTDEDLQQEYWASDFPTSTIQTHNLTYLTIDNTNLEIRAFNFTNFGTPEIEFFKQENSLYLKFANGGFDNDILNSYEIYSIDEMSLILEKELVNVGPPFVESRYLSPTFSSSDITVYFENPRDNLVTHKNEETIENVNTPRPNDLLGFGGSTVAGAILRARTNYNLKSPQGISNSLIYIIDDDYSKLQEQYLDLETRSIVILESEHKYIQPTIIPDGYYINFIMLIIALVLLISPKLSSRFR